MSPSHKNLNQYFEAAKAQEPVMPLEELQETLNQLPASSTIGKQTSAGAGKTTAFWTAGSLSIVAALALLWNMLSQEPEAVQPPVVKESTATETQLDEKQMASLEPIQAQNIDSARFTAKASSIKRLVSAAGSNANAIATGGTKIEPRETVANNQTSAKVSAKPGSMITKPGEKVFDRITLLELPQETEQKLGIQINDQGIRYERLFNDPAEGMIRLEVTVYGGEHSVGLGDPTLVLRDGKFVRDSSRLYLPVTKFVPMYISNRKGERRVMYRTDSEDERKFEPEYFNEIVNTLIPVLVKANNKAKDEAIFWFSATPDFLAQLPKPLHQAIAQEYQLLEDQKQAEESSMAKVGTATQLKYFESKPGSLSSIQYAVVFPNPVSEWLNLSMSLKREEEMRVSLVDINGSLVKTLSPYKRYAAGSVTEKFLIKGTPRGLYLLLAETKSGHKHTQRIIIE
ncbi:T9SS type A sorting domain-containing protein [Rufibacter aurantiacus]|uniref:T9SS type A sorting domain-containing protein n=1 Tax=Rufibacter aurantiacus TaxID=2817374 RepID=UPI001B3173DC|nr:T9SS type A sorting domain-containing protein [Rufibacter aurantiacus]